MFNLFQVLNCSLEKQEYECEIIPYYGEDKTTKTFEKDLTKLKEVEGVVIFIKTADNIIKSFLQINSNNQNLYFRVFINLKNENDNKNFTSLYSDVQFHKITNFFPEKSWDWKQKLKDKNLTQINQDIINEFDKLIKNEPLIELENELIKNEPLIEKTLNLNIHQVEIIYKEKEKKTNSDCFIKIKFKNKEHFKKTHDLTTGDAVIVPENKKKSRTIYYITGGIIILGVVIITAGFFLIK